MQDRKEKRQKNKQKQVNKSNRNNKRWILKHLIWWVKHQIIGALEKRTKILIRKNKKWWQQKNY
jgi:hypothetical protein